MTTGGLRAERMARLGRLLDAQAALGNHDTRHRIDRLLDRDAPFLELAPLAPGPVTGIGLVEGTGCVVVAGPAEDPPGPKAARAAALAATHGLPLVAVSEEDDAAVTARLRQDVRHGSARPAAGGGAAPVEPPATAEPDAILDAARVADVLDHVLDGSRLDVWADPAPAGLLTGWGAIGGLPVAVVGRDGPPDADDGPVPLPDPPDGFAARLQASPRPLVRLTVDGADATLAVSDDQGRSAFAFSWPAAQPGDAGDDGAVDPRDTRIVLAIARWCVDRP